MRSNFFVLASAVALTALFGCSPAEPPAEVRSDVKDAQLDAARDVNEARQEHTETVIDAQSKVIDEAHDADMAQQKSAYEVAIAEAEGEANVAIESCEAMAGDHQIVCKDEVEAKLELAKANARALYPDAE